MSLHEKLQKTDAFILSEVCCLPGLHALTKQIATWERIMWQRTEGGLWSRASKRDFPGSPVVKACPSNAASAGSILGQGAKIPHASQSRNQNINNRSNIATNSIKIL